MEQVTIRITIGYSQGGVLSPHLWYLAISLDLDLDSQGYEVFGFADDIEVLLTRMQTALNSESNWCKE
jgi:hypothetical protein